MNRFIGSMFIILFFQLTAHATTLWHFKNEQYIRIDSSSHATNNHPFTLSSEQLAHLLSSVYVIENDDTVRVFTLAEVEHLAPYLAQGLSEASTQQDISFALVGMHQGTLARENRLSSGRVFIQDNQLNLLFNRIHEKIDFSLDRRLHPILPAQRQQSLAVDWALTAEAGQALVNQRKDWIAIDIEAVLKQPKLSTVTQARQQQKVSANLQSEQQNLQQQVSELKQTVEALKQQPRPSQTKPAIVAPVPSANMNNDAARIKQRLTTLKQLHSQGIITDTEYQQKRQAILDDI